MWSTKISKAQRKKLKNKHKYKITKQVITDKLSQNNIVRNNSLTKCSSVIPLQSTSNTNIIASIKANLPLFESIQILPSVVKSLKLTDFDPNDDRLKIQILDCIISNLENSINDNDKAIKHYNYNEYLPEHKALLTNGYINEYSNKLIPSDIINLIYKFFNNSFIWTIKDEAMDKLLTTKNGKVMYGPNVHPINGMELQLTMCPNGWLSHQNGYSACFVELRTFPDEIKEITITYTLYLKQMQFEYKKTIIYHKDGYRIAHGWCPYSISLQDIKKNNINSLDVMYIADIVHVEYEKNSKLRNIISYIPLIEDVMFEWKIDEEMLEKFKNAKEFQYFYNDTVTDNCWILSVAPNGLNKITNHNLWLFVELLRLPFGIKSVKIGCVLIADIGDNVIKKEVSEWIGLDMNEGTSSIGDNMFATKQLDTITHLIFTVKIHIHQKK